ncbi:hypothetical protein BCR41DRAFT_360744 [Lobosporangium transversale]|uniref:Uncharacterized protein n=1 Tax=Lobosporangium transversale TaxID=64571 RepID=A0A1Y2GCA4_9FUNG|nr:hypothetical protein BCR41DRAFT_360744 [Lobosporangium transversale]ORZ06818.1 hypothetical protein BCR41DRAFT_360744 [Lobosporangium transversale]|eukprot:XP_021877739.1 hypothetical protein BCR41DRAFT_360744 [Lobosporangium transversale]
MNILHIIFSNFIPSVYTPDGLRQYQLTLLGFIVIYGLLHLSLFMDGLVSHLFFVPEIATALHYAFFPVQYSLRPLSALRRRFYILNLMVIFWLLQPFLQLNSMDFLTSILTTITTKVSPSSVATGTERPSSLFDTRENLTLYVSKTLNQIQIEKILSEGGKVEEGFKEQSAYAAQLAVAMQCLGWFSVLIAVFILIESLFVWYKCQQIEKLELSSAEREKQETLETLKTAAAAAAQQAASAAASASAATAEAVAASEKVKKS